MTDKREAILVRLTDLLAELDFVETVVRNKDSVNEEDRPAIVIFDGEEETVEGESVKAGRAPLIIQMRPEVLCLIGDVPAEVGTVVNEWRANILRAVLTDSELAAIVGANGRVRYDGCRVSLGQGQRVEAELSVNFSVFYPLVISQL